MKRLLTLLLLCVCLPVIGQRFVEEVADINALKARNVHGINKTVFVRGVNGGIFTITNSFMFVDGFFRIQSTFDPTWSYDRWIPPANGLFNFGSQFDQSANTNINLAVGLATTNQTLAGGVIAGTRNLGSISGAINVDANSALEFNALLSGDTTVTFTNYPDYHPINFSITNAGNNSITFAYATPIYNVRTGNTVQETNDWGAGVFNTFPFWKTGGRVVLYPKAGLGTNAWDVNNVKFWGATGNGSTIDTASLRTAMTRGTNTIVYFPSGVYRVVITNTTPYETLFKLRSGMKIIGDSATIVVNADGIGTGWSAVFGVATNELVKDASITGLNFIRTGTNSIAAINPSPGYDRTTNCVENLHISNCRFENFGSAVYAIFQWTGTNGTAFRPVNGVMIENCVAKDCFGSFVTADQANVTIQNNIAVGCSSNLALAFDAISIHSGQNIKVLHNYLSDYGAGEGVNIRNSIENYSGTDGVLVQGNHIWNITNRAAISVTASAGETNWGVKNITISGNQSWNTLNGIYVDTGANIDPFSQIVINGNSLTNKTGGGITVITPIGAPITYVKVGDNFVHMGGPSKYGLKLSGLFFANVSGNMIVCDGSGSSRALQGDNLSYLNLTGNSFLAFSGDPIGSFVDTTISSVVGGNHFYGAVHGTNIDANTYFTDNKTPSGLTLNGTARGLFHAHIASADIDDTLHVANNTGIGTAAPYEKLEVAGAIAATGVTSATAAQGPATLMQYDTYGKLTAVDWGVGYKPLTLEASEINFATGNLSVSSNLTVRTTGVWVRNLTASQFVLTDANSNLVSGTGGTFPLSIPNGGTGTNAFADMFGSVVFTQNSNPSLVTAPAGRFQYSSGSLSITRTNGVPGVALLLLADGPGGGPPIAQFTANGIYFANTNSFIDYSLSKSFSIRNGVDGNPVFQLPDTNVVVGAGNTSTTRTNDFLYIPVSAGPPTGAPSAIAGHVPLTFDNVNTNLYIYLAGWKKFAWSP